MKTLPKMTEATFTRTVLELAHLLWWRSAHFRPARTSKGWRTAVAGDGRGFPDLVLVRGNRLLVAELKVGKGKLTPDQAHWLTAFASAGVPAYVWRPDDWDALKRVLEEP